jgi:predicted secreted protein
MKWTSALAIFLLFWVMSAFLVMPFGVRNSAEMGVEKVPGQEDGAPANFNPKRILIRTTLLAIVLFALFYLNYVNEWISLRTLGAV